MQNRLLTMFRIEIALGLVGAALFALTLAAPDWMEARFGLAPDSGDGAAEWAIALGWAAASLLMFGFAARTRRMRARRLRAA